jgi:hypothetical protein
VTEPAAALEQLAAGPSAPVDPDNGVALVDASGTTHTASPTEAANAIKTGKWTLARDQKLGIKDEGGRIKIATPEEAMAHLANGGQLAGAREAEQHARHEKYGDIGGMAAAGGEALVRGATLGGSDRAAIGAARLYGGDQAAEATREHLLQGQVENPYLSTSAELVGNVLPGMLTGGAAEGAEAASLASRGIRAAGALPRALAGAGELAGGAVRGLLPEASSLAGKVAVSGLSHGLTGAVEGAGYGLAGALDESSLNGGDHELTAEQLIAAAGHGALAGGLLGGAAGSGVEAASEGIGKLAGKAADGMGSGAVKEFFENLAKNKAFHAVGPDLRASRYAESRIAGGPEAVGKFVLDELPKAAGMTIEHMNLTDFNSAAEKVKAGAFEQLDKHLNAFDAMDPALRPKAVDVVAHVRSIADELRGKVGHESLAAAADSVVESLERRFGIVKVTEGGLTPEVRAQMEQAANANKTISYRDLRNARRDLDDVINKGRTNPLLTSPIQQELKKMRWAIEDTMLDSVEKAGGEQGAAMRADYNAAKKQAQLARFVEDTTADKIARQENTNVHFGLRSAGMGMAAVASGHGLAAVPMMMATKYATEHGNQIVAGLANRAAHLSAVQGAADRVTSIIGSAMRGYISRTAEQIGVPLAVRGWKGKSARSIEEGYRKQAEAVREASANPSKHVDALGGRIGSLAKHAPTVAGIVAAKSSAAQAYLASKLPPAAPSPSSLQPFLRGAPPSDGQMASFLRIAAVVKSPLSLLGELHSGRVTQDQVDVIKELYPKLYGQIQEATMAAIAKRPSAVPYEKRKTLGILLSIPTDPILEPSVVAEMQKSYSPSDTGEPPQKSGQGHAKAAHVSIASNVSSDLEAASSRTRAS